MALFLVVASRDTGNGQAWVAQYLPGAGVHPQPTIEPRLGDGAGLLCSHVAVYSQEAEDIAVELRMDLFRTFSMLPDREYDFAATRSNSPSNR